jgi:hypothetical protein
LEWAIMSPLSYSDLFGITHERDYEEHIAAGDRVRMGANFHPHFEVLAVNGDKAWVRSMENGADHIAALSRCRKLAPAE